MLALPLHKLIVLIAVTSTLLYSTANAAPDHTQTLAARDTRKGGGPYKPPKSSWPYKGDGKGKPSPPYSGKGKGKSGLGRRQVTTDPDATEQDITQGVGETVQTGPQTGIGQNNTLAGPDTGDTLLKREPLSARGYRRGRSYKSKKYGKGRFHRRQVTTDPDSSEQDVTQGVDETVQAGPQAGIGQDNILDGPDTGDALLKRDPLAARDYHKGKRGGSYRSRNYGRYRRGRRFGKGKRSNFRRRQVNPRPVSTEQDVDQGTGQTVQTGPQVGIGSDNNLAGPRLEQPDASLPVTLPVTTLPVAAN